MSNVLRSLFAKRATMESPSVPLSAAYDILGGNNKTTTGEVITNNKALGLPPFWKGVNLISRAVAKTPLCIYKRNLNAEGKEEDKQHNAWRLLRKMATGSALDAPMSAYTFKQTVTGNALSFGNGYGAIVRDSMAQPIMLIWLDPERVVPLIENGKLLYIFQQPDGSTIRIRPVDIIHIKGLGYDGITGYSVIHVLRESLGLNSAYQKNEAVFFKNAMRPGWVVQVPWQFKDHSAVTEFRKRLGSVHQGLENAHIPAILEKGAEAKPLSMSHEDAQFIQNREFELRMLANILLLPASKLNDNAKSAYNSLEQENQSTLDEAYDPWFAIWEDECEFKLLTEEEKERDTHVVSFKRNTLIQVNFKDKIDGYNKASLAGWLNRDEIRNKEDMNPIPDGVGKGYYQPVNVKVAGEDPPEVEPIAPPKVEPELPKDEEEKLAASAAIAQDALRGVIERSIKRVATQARRKSTDPNKFMSWVLDDIQDNHQVIVDMIEPMIRLCKLLGNDTTEYKVVERVDVWLSGLQKTFNELAGRVDRTALITEVDLMMIRQESSVDSFVNKLLEN